MVNSIIGRTECIFPLFSRERPVTRAGIDSSCAHRVSAERSHFSVHGQMNSKTKHQGEQVSAFQRKS